MRRGSPKRRGHTRGQVNAATCSLTTRRSLAGVTTEEFERLNEEEAELWIAERYRRFVESGLAPDLSLIFAANPNVEVPRTSRHADRRLDGAA
jgi:hypothetical protein